MNNNFLNNIEMNGMKAIILQICEIFILEIENKNFDIEKNKKTMEVLKLVYERILNNNDFSLSKEEAKTIIEIIGEIKKKYAYNNKEKEDIDAQIEKIKIIIECSK